jgi:hypothetical protein
VQDLALLVFPELEDDRIQSIADPADSQILFRNVGSLVEPVRPAEQLLHFFESDASLRIRPEALALSRIVI